MNSVVKKCFVIALLVNFIGLTGCEISDYSELARKNKEQGDNSGVTEGNDAAGSASTDPGAVR